MVNGIMEIEDIDIDEEKSTFLGDFKSKRKCSLWFSWILILLLIPEIMFLLITHAIILLKSPNLKVRCAIPSLEKSDWTFDEIRNISHPYNVENDCRYLDYNYTVLKNMDYDEAFTFVKHLPKPNLIKCFNVVTKNDDNYYTIYKEFNLFCEECVKHCVIITPIFGIWVGCAILVPFADIYGRKPVLTFGINSFLVAILIVNFVSVIEPFLAGRFLSGISYSTIKVTSEALVVELISPIHRPYVYFILKACSSGIVFSIIPILFGLSQNNWRHLQWICSSGLLFFPLVKWYIPESPHWLFSIKKKGKAWAILKILRQPENLNESLLIHRNEDKITMQYFINHYKSLYFAMNWHFLASIVLVSITAASYVKNYVEIFDGIFELDGHYKNLVYAQGLIDFGTLILSALGVYVIGRKNVIIALQVLTILEYCSLCFNLGSTAKIIVYFLLEFTTSSTYMISTLHCSENTPSSHRCTLLGLYGVASSSTTIIIFSLIFHINSSICFIIMSCASMIGIFATIFTFPENKRELFDNFPIKTKEIK